MEQPYPRTRASHDRRGSGRDRSARHRDFASRDDTQLEDCVSAPQSSRAHAPHTECYAPYSASRGSRGRSVRHSTYHKSSSSKTAQRPFTLICHARRPRHESRGCNLHFPGTSTRTLRPSLALGPRRLNGKGEASPNGHDATRRNAPVVWKRKCCLLCSLSETAEHPKSPLLSPGKPRSPAQQIEGSPQDQAQMERQKRRPHDRRAEEASASNHHGRPRAGGVEAWPKRRVTPRLMVRGSVTRGARETARSARGDLKPASTAGASRAAKRGNRSGPTSAAQAALGGPQQRPHAPTPAVSRSNAD